VPYVPVAAHGLSVELGAGCLVMLRDPATGELRRGLGSGASDAESTVKAVLNALNRYLSGPDGDEVD
jgi:hypothetical protein